MTERDEWREAERRRWRGEVRRNRAERRAMPFGCAGLLLGLFGPAVVLGLAGEAHVIDLPITGVIISLLTLASTIGGCIWAHRAAARFFEARDRND